MRLNNLQVVNIYTILNSKCQNLDDIKLKWKLVGLSEQLFNIYHRFEKEKNELIQKYGKEDEKIGQMTLSGNDKHFKELLMCETEVSPILLSDLQGVPLSLDELMVLKPIIKE